MKSVSGNVLSSKPVSVSKAAKVLSKFVSSDNGASPAFAAYLRRASASFDELAQLHKEQKRSGSQHEVKKQKQHSHGGSVTEVTEVTDGSVVNRSRDGKLAKEIGTSKKKVRGVDKIEREVGRIEVDENVGKHNAGRSSMKFQVRESEGIVDGDVEIEKGAGKKSKKKKEKSESGLLTVKDQSYSDHDTVNGDELKNQEKKKKKGDIKKEKSESGLLTVEDQPYSGHDTFNGDELKNQEKKKNKRDIKKEKSESGLLPVEDQPYSDQNAVNGNELKNQEKKKKKREIKKEVLNDEGDVQAIEADISYNDKKKKHKKDKHHGDNAVVDLIEVKNEVNSIKVKNEVESFDGSKDRKKNRKIRDKPEKEKSDDPVDMEKEKKHKKKRTHEESNTEYEGKLEIESPNNKKSRKRKHESVVDEGIENSEEKHKSKKKKR